MLKQKRLLALALGIALAAGGLRAAIYQQEARKLLRRPSLNTAGMGDSLAHQVSALENELAARALYSVPKGPNPFDLRRVVHLAAPAVGKEKTEGEGMRLSMTLISPEKSLAIIKHHGQSFTLGLGDTLAGHVLRAIDKQTVTLTHGDKTVLLINRPAPQSELQAEGGGQRLKELKL